VRAVRVLLLILGLIGLVALVSHLGADAIVAAVARVTWWQFALICAVHALSVVADTLAWRLTLTGERPSIGRLYAARCAGEAFNLVTTLGSVGGEAVKAWVLRREVPYEASVPSLILAKTSLVVAQVWLLALGVVLLWATGTGRDALLGPMTSLLAVEIVAVGGFLAVQIYGVIGRAGRLLRWLGGVERAERLDHALRSYYRDAWPAFVASAGLHLVGWLIGAVEALLVLHSLRIPATAGTALIIEALGSGVRFATFLVPASLGTLEGANAAAFAALGWTASAGLAFTLVRRARQVVWIGLGVAAVVATRARGPEERKRAEPAPSRAH
jgi:uncharacterized membrane protein YbhN (UPF0104 family)